MNAGKERATVKAIHHFRIKLLDFKDTVKAKKGGHGQRLQNGSGN